MAIKVLNRATGKLEEHADKATALRVVAESQGALSIPHPDEVERIERVAQHGDTGSQALAAVETVGRTATFGAWQGVGSQEEIDARRQTLREESPGTAFAAEAVGTIAPAVVGGAGASAAARAAGAGARAVGAASVAAEGAAGGFASEVEEAAAEQRPISPGLALLTGIGGEVLGRALPAAIRSGVNRVLPATDAASVVAGEAVADVSTAAAKRARAQLVEDAYHMPPGPDRDAALARTADEQIARADSDIAASSASALEQLERLSKASTKDLTRLVPGTSPAQIRWAADTAAELRLMAESAPEAHRAELLRAAKELVEADDSDGIWKATASARERLRRAPAEPAPAAPVKAAAPDAAPVAVQRNANGARLVSSPVTKDSAPDFSDWDVADFAKGRGAGKAAGKVAGDYSGGERISQYQRSIVDGLKQNQEFASTGRISGDAGKLGSEPTFVMQPDGTVKLDHGRLRLTAARELGRETVFGRVVRGKGKSQQIVYEGQIRVAAPGRAQPTQPGPAPANPFAAADDLLARGQRDPALFGRAANGAADLHGSAAHGPGTADPINALEAQLEAAKRWNIGTEKAREGLAAEVRRMRAAQALKDDTKRALASVGATGQGKAPKPKDAVGALLREGVEFAVERALGGSVPFAGTIVRKLWGAIGDSGQAKIQRTVRGMLAPVTSQGRMLGASRSGAAATALQLFAGDAPDARSAYESRREMLGAVAANPLLATDVIASSLAGLAQEDPRSFMLLSQRMVEGLQYVAQNLPPTVAVSLAYPTGIPITDSELRDVADLWNTAIYPGSAMDDIEALRASPTQMRTLRECHPDIYDGLRRELFMQAGENFQSIPAQAKLSLDIMFQADGLGGLFASSEAARYVTEARNQAMKRARKQESSLSPDIRQETSDSIEPAGVRAVRTGVTNRGSS